MGDPKTDMRSAMGSVEPRLSGGNTSVLLKQYELLTEDIRVLMTSNDRLISVGFTILGAAYAFGMKEPSDTVKLALPFFVFSVVFYTLFIYTNVFALGGHKQFIEEQINGGQPPLLFWERVAGKMIFGNIPSIFLIFIYGGFTIFTTWFGIDAFREISKAPLPIICYCTVLGFCIGGLVWSTVRMLRTYGRAYKFSVDFYSAALTSENACDTSSIPASAADAPA